MKPLNLKEQEKDNSFKKKHLPKSFWVKQGAIYPPSLVLFFALFSLIYLLKTDLLLSFYALPFFILFLLGAIWLKMVRKYILKNLLEDERNFLISIAEVVKSDSGGLIWAMFAKSKKRHDKNYIKAIKKELTNNDFWNSTEFSDIAAAAKSSAVLLPEDLTGDKDVYIKVFRKSDITKINKGWTESDSFFLLFIEKANVVLLKLKSVSF